MTDGLLAPIPCPDEEQGLTSHGNTWEDINNITSQQNPGPTIGIITPEDYGISWDKLQLSEKTNLIEEIFILRDVISRLLIGERREDVLSSLPSQMIWAKRFVPKVNAIKTDNITPIGSFLGEFFPELTGEGLSADFHGIPDTVKAFFVDTHHSIALANIIEIFRNVKEINFETVLAFVQNAIFEANIERWLKAKYDFEYRNLIPYPRGASVRDWEKKRDQATLQKIEEYRAMRAQLTKLYFTQNLFEASDCETEAVIKTHEEIERLKALGVVPFFLTRRFQKYYEKYSEFLERIKSINLTGKNLKSFMRGGILPEEYRERRDEVNIFRGLLQKCIEMIQSLNYINLEIQLEKTIRALFEFIM